MNYLKPILAITISAIFTGIALAVTFYLTERNSNSSTMLGPARNFALLGLVFGAVLGLVLGAVSGAVIVGFRLNLLKAILFGFIFYLIVGAAFYIYSGGGWNDSLTYDLFSNYRWNYQRCHRFTRCLRRKGRSLSRWQES